MEKEARNDKTLLLIPLAVLGAFFLYLLIVGYPLLGPLVPIFIFLSFFGILSLLVFLWENGEYSLIYISFSILLLFLSCFMTVSLFLSPQAFIFAFMSLIALISIRQFLIARMREEKEDAENL
jgi:O-antigen ligase